MKPSLKNFRSAQYLLFGPRCWACGKELKRRADFCYRCQREIFRALHREGCLFRYEGAVTGLLNCLRGSAPRLAVEWAFHFLKREGVIEQWRSQGFNQLVLAPQNQKGDESGLELLGKRIVAELKIPLRKPFRKTAGRTQHGRNVSERMDAPCFITLREKIAGRALLLDDVHTTGTTLDQCAYLLRQSGAELVETYSLARQMMPSFERKKAEAEEKSHEMDPLLLHFFV